MTKTTPSDLQAHLLDHYDVLLNRLSGRLGSRDLAGDVLQDTYVKLASAKIGGEVRHPTSYLMRMALNLSANIRRKSRRLLSFEEVTTLLDIPDDGVDPERTMQSRADLAVVKRVMSEMSPRHFDICASVWVEGLSTTELAERHGLTVRMIQHVLRQASLKIQRTLAEPRVVALRESAARVSSVLEAEHNEECQDGGPS